MLRYPKIYDLHTQGRAVTHEYASKRKEYCINRPINPVINYLTVIALGTGSPKLTEMQALMKLNVSW